MSKTSLTLIAAALSFAACSDDPVSYSSPVGIELKSKSGDVSGSAISEEKGITTESSNPYGAFISDSRSKLGGHDPGMIELDKLTLTLGGQSNNVVALDEVFTGDVDVAFTMNDSNNTYDVGHFTNPTGTGPVGASSITWDYASVSEVDVAKALGGSFKVVVRGPAATGFQSKGAEAQLQLTFTFTAFE